MHVPALRYYTFRLDSACLRFCADSAWVFCVQLHVPGLHCSWITGLLPDSGLPTFTTALPACLVLVLDRCWVPLRHCLRSLTATFWILDAPLNSPFTTVLPPPFGCHRSPACLHTPPPAAATACLPAWMRAVRLPATHSRLHAVLLDSGLPPACRCLPVAGFSCPAATHTYCVLLPTHTLPFGLPWILPWIAY